MIKLKLKLKKENPALIKKGNKVIGKIPVEVENIRPDLIKDMSFSELEQLEIRAGKEVYKLKKFFEIEGKPAEEIEIEGLKIIISRTGEHKIDKVKIISDKAINIDEK